MHAVLHLQANRANPQHHEPLKERLRQASLCSFFTHHNRTELAVVTYKDKLWKEKCNQWQKCRYLSLYSLKPAQ